MTKIQTREKFYIQLYRSIIILYSLDRISNQTDRLIFEPNFPFYRIPYPIVWLAQSVSWKITINQRKSERVLIRASLSFHKRKEKREKGRERKNGRDVQRMQRGHISSSIRERQKHGFVIWHGEEDYSESKRTAFPRELLSFVSSSFNMHTL